MKRKTEQQKKDALLQRVMDIYAGAAGGVVTSGEAASVAAVQKVMGAVNDLWVSDDGLKHLIGYWNVDEYETPEKAVDFLYRNGVRA